MTAPLRERFGDAAEIIIPPLKNAILSPQSETDPTDRDRHIITIQAHGHIAWQRSTGYNLRSRGEAQIGRWKTTIGPKLSARNIENPKTETGIGVRVLNRMTDLGRPKFERIQ